MGIWRGIRKRISIGALATAASVFSFSPARAELSYFGVNLSGAEYGEGVYPGTLGTNYFYPTSAEVDYFMSKGMNTFRVPFSWERMQPVKSGLLDADQLGLMDTFVNYTTSLGANVILDPHNFAAYYGEVIGAAGSSVSAANFANLWSQLADHYQSNDHVIFGLMNEPVGLGDSRPGGTTEEWLNSANAAISAIRETGASNLILVPGNGYTGAGSWYSNYYGTPNSEVMGGTDAGGGVFVGGVDDPLNNFAYEVHLYLDEDGSGRSDEIFEGNLNIGSVRLSDFTEWLAEHHARGFLGEFGVSAGTDQAAALDNLLNYVDAHSDVWLGWNYWAAGPRNQDSFSIEPDVNGDKPQLTVLQNHIAAVPEPRAIWLMLGGLGILAVVTRARSRRAAA